MSKYIFKKIYSAGFLLIGIIVFTFFLSSIAPGSPAARLFNPAAGVKVMKDMEKNIGFDLPVYKQMFNWFKNILKGNFGRSFSKNESVNHMLAEAVPNTLLLTVPALVFQIIFGMTIGVVQVLHRGQSIDRFLSIMVLFIIAVPTFWLALMLVMLFSQKLGLLPSSHMFTFSFQQMNIAEKFLDRLYHLVLPVLSLGLVSGASLGRYVRNCLLDVMSKPFVRTLRSKGFSDRYIVLKHALRNAMVPIVTVIGQYFPALIGSSIVIELIFSWPGMGRMMIFACYARDFPVILACTLVISAFVVTGNLLADLLCAWLDPRIRFQRY